MKTVQVPVELFVKMRNLIVLDRDRDVIIATADGILLPLRPPPEAARRPPVPEQPGKTQEGPNQSEASEDAKPPQE